MNLSLVLAFGFYKSTWKIHFCICAAEASMKNPFLEKEYPHIHGTLNTAELKQAEEELGSWAMSCKSSSWYAVCGLSDLELWPVAWPWSCTCLGVSEVVRTCRGRMRWSLASLNSTMTSLNGEFERFRITCGTFPFCLQSHVFNLFCLVFKLLDWIILFIWDICLVLTRDFIRDFRSIRSLKP